DRREPERELPGAAQLEPALENWEPRIEIALANVEGADTRVGGRQRERMVDRPGGPEGPAADSDPLRQPPQLRPTRDQTGSGMHRGELSEPEGLERALTVQVPDVALKETSRASIVAECVVRLSQIGVRA